MHPAIFEAFDRICRTEGVGGRILEIGARPSADTLLCLPALAEAGERIGLDLDGPHRWQGMAILAGNANRMEMFADASFDAVLCNSVLEHDSRFWQTLSEVRRVVKPGGLFVVGVPGFAEMGSMPLRRLAGILRYCPGLGREASLLRVSSATLGIHNYPADYYRFSRQAVAEVFLEGFRSAEVISIVEPPRFIGWGRRSG